MKENLGIEANDNSTIDKEMGSSNNNNGPINWHNYNYPPIFKIIHYSTD